MRPDVGPRSPTWSLAQRALACSKPRCRTFEQINVITDLLAHLDVFQGVERDDLLAVAYFIESKHSEAGECVLSKGQPLEQWCLLLTGGALLTRYSAQKGAEQSTAQMGPQDSWGEAGLLHSTLPRKSSVTVVAGPQGCLTLRLRYSDYDAIVDTRTPMMLLPPEGTQGPLAVPEVTMTQRRAGSMALLTCCLRRLVSNRAADVRTPEEASELEPFLCALPAFKAHPAELVSHVATACRTLKLPAGSLVYEYGNLADAHVTVLSGEVQLRRPAGGEDADGDASGGGSAAAGGSGAAAAAAASSAAGPGGAAAAAAGGALVRPVPPPGTKPGSSGPEAAESSGARLDIRARLRREREARKIMQRQLDEYVSRMEVDSPRGTSPRTSGVIKDPSSNSHVDWTRVFMQKAMRTVEPVWKALHPADKAHKRRPTGADAGFDMSLDGGDGPITEVAQLLGPAAAKAYYRGLQSQGYSDSDSPPSPVRPKPSEADGGGGGGGGSGGGSGGTTRERWRRWMFSVDGPETEKERTLRNMALSASRIYRDRHARSRSMKFDAEEVEEMYGPLITTLTRGSGVGELSVTSLHTTMRAESAVAGPGGCELLLVDWEAYQQGVLAARAAVLARAATFLASLPKDRLTQLAELCLCLCVDQGTLLARQGTPLESMVVVQEGEVSLLHEPSAALHTRISTVRALAVRRSRSGRTMLMPLLSTLSQSSMPSAAAAAAASGGTAAPAPPPAAAASASAAGGGGGGAAAAAAGTTSVAPSGGSFSGVPGTPVDITLQGLLLGELGAGGILGEEILGARSSGSGAPPSASPYLNGHLDPSHLHGHNHGQQGQHVHAGDSAGHAGAVPLPTVVVTGDGGPKWPATVLAARASVLLVMPRSVLYMPEFDFIRSDLVRFATERRTWLARRVEAAYRAAAAPPTTPAVFATAAAAAAAAAGASGPGGAGAASGGPTPPQPPQPLPLLRRPVLSGAAAADGGGGGASMPHIGSFPRRAASGDVTGAGVGGIASQLGGGGGNAVADLGPTGHMPVFRRRSVEHPQRSTSPVTHGSLAAAAAAAAAAAGGPIGTSGGGGQNSGGFPTSRSNSKWDFLDTPTAATTGATTMAGAEASASTLAPLTGSCGSFTRTGAPGAVSSLLDSSSSLAAFSVGPTLSGPVLTGSYTPGVSPLRRPSSANLRASKEAAMAAAAAAAAGAAVSGPPSGSSLAGGAGGVGPDLSGLTLVQQALLEVGLDPHAPATAATLESPYDAGGSGAGGSAVATLPALGPPSISATGVGGPLPRTLAPLVIAGGSAGGGGGAAAAAAVAAGPSPSASVDFDALRSSGVQTPFRSPNLLTPTSAVRRSANAASGVMQPSLSVPPSLLDSGGAASLPLSPSSVLAGLPGYASVSPTSTIPSPVRATRASHSGTASHRRRTDFDGAAAATLPATGALSVPPPPVLSPRIPALQALDALENAAAAAAAAAGPPAPSLFGRSARASCTGGVTPRVASVDSAWLSGASRAGFLGALRGRCQGRDGGGAAAAVTVNGSTELSPLGPTDADAEEEAALARSLVPKNQAGMFMVRGGVASTPTKQPAVRRIAGCF